MKFPPRQRKGFWVSDVTWPDGRRTRLRRRTEAEAAEIAVRIEAAFLEGGEAWRALRDRLKAPKYPRHVRAFATFGELADHYLDQYCAAYNRSVASKESRIRMLKRQLGNVPLSELRLVDAEHYISYRRAQGVKTATINRDLSVLRHLTRWAADRGYLEADPLERLRMLPEPRWEGQRPTYDVIDAVFAELPSVAAPLFTFMRETACRRGEALQLEHWQVDRQSRTVLFPAERTKSGKSRRIPLSPVALEAVDAVPRVNQWVFYNPDTLKPWDSARSIWNRARRRAGVPWLLMKDLRKALAIRAAEAGVPLHFIQALLGHASVQLTERHYAQYSPGQASTEVLAALPPRPAAPPPRRPPGRVLKLVKG